MRRIVALVVLCTAAFLAVAVALGRGDGVEPARSGPDRAAGGDRVVATRPGGSASVPPPVPDAGQSGGPDAVRPAAAPAARPSIPSSTARHGRVLDGAGQPVAAATVLAFGGFRHGHTDGEARRAVDWSTAQVVAVSGADGRFAGPAAAATPLVAVHGDSLAFATDAAGADRLVLAATAVVEVEVVDDAGRPRAGVTVTAWPAVTEVFPTWPAPFDPSAHPALAAFATITGTDGIARFPTLPAPRPDTTVIATARDAAGRVANATLEVGPGRPARVTLRLAAPTPQRIAGRVVDRAGQPIAAATVTVGGDPPRRARTGVDGRFATGPVRAPRQLTITAPGFVEHRVDAAAVAVDDLRIVLDQRTALWGDVVDDAGRPVAEAAVWLTGPDGRVRHTVCDGAGAFRFDDAAAGREHRVQTAGAMAWAMVPADSPIRLVARDEQPARLVATLRAGDGSPLDGHAVRLEPTDGRLTARPALRPVRGGARADEVPPGAWRLVVTPRSGAPIVAEFDAAPGQREIALDLTQPAAVAVDIAVVGEPETAGPLELVFVGPDRGRFDAAHPGQVLDANRIRIDALPATLRVVDCAADRPLTIAVAGAGPLGGRVTLPRAAAGRGLLRVAARATVQVAAPRPWRGPVPRMIWTPTDGGPPCIRELAQPATLLLDAGRWTWRLANEATELARPVDLRPGSTLEIAIEPAGR